MSTLYRGKFPELRVFPPPRFPHACGMERPRIIWAILTVGFLPMSTVFVFWYLDVGKLNNNKTTLTPEAV